MSEQDEIAEFARLFTGFLERMQDPPTGNARENLKERLRTHLGVDPEELPVVSASFPSFDLPNVQLALEAWFDGFEVIGLAGSDRLHHSFSELLELSGRHRFGVGTVDYQRISIAVDEEMDCVAFGFYLGFEGEDRTVVLLAGTSIRFISEACGLARLLQPALVLLEDCDLVAEARDFSHGSGNPLLFQVLNEMDGLDEDADVAFLLTTNRADLLEPALSQRPGRIDLAVEVPLPDTAGRARLLKLYGPGLQVGPETVDEVVALTEGTTASFAKELVRRSVLLAAERGSEITGDADLRAAAAELLSAQDTLTRRLLGGTPTDPSSSMDWSPASPSPGLLD
jgi:ATPase family protein associated with various cellular activities (AAA)